MVEFEIPKQGVFKRSQLELCCPFSLEYFSCSPGAFQDQRRGREVVLFMVAFMCLKTGGRKLLLKDTFKLRRE